MLKIYFKTAFQTLIKHKGYSITNVFGLTLGFTCCILIALYVNDELSYDRYHEKADRTFKVVTDSRSPESESQFALTPAPLGGVLVRDYPEVETATRLFTLLSDVVVASGNNVFNENRIFAGDSTFFEVFSIPMLTGDPATALTSPNTIVLTQKMAQKYFGDADPVGKILRLTINNSFDVEVTGVIHNVPRNTHFSFDFLLSLSSFRGFSSNPSFITNINFHTYIVLREGASAKALEVKFSDAIERYAAAQVVERFGQSYRARTDAGHSMEWSLVPLTDIHLYSHRDYEIEPNASITTVYIFSAIALIILIIACVNFMNLSTALSTGRTKEIAVRKIAGSGRGQLVGQLLVEPVLLSCFAMLLALVLVELLLPAFDALAGKQIEAGFFKTGLWVILLFFVTVLTGIAAGGYSAFILSSLKPVAALKGELAPKYRASWVRQGLVVFQFTISIALIIGTLIVRNQLDFIKTKRLGFDKEEVLVITRAQSLGQQYDAFKRQLLEKPHIVNVAASFSLPGGLFGRSMYRDYEDPPETAYGIHQVFVDKDFIPTMGMTLIAGRNFSNEIASDSSAVILNRSAAELFGWKHPIGKELAYTVEGAPVSGKVIGIVEDFHFESLHKPIQPLVILHQPYYQYVSIRFMPENVPAIVQHVESTWKSFVPHQPFESSFLDRDIEALYRAEEQTGKVFGIFAVLAIFIACLGQIGLAALTIAKRTKEIGIHKVLGATVTNIVSLLSKDFLKLVLIAVLVAVPPAWIIMNRWLEDFAYRIDIGWWVFALAGGLVLLIALLTVSTQAIKAALANPAEALRNE